MSVLFIYFFNLFFSQPPLYTLTQLTQRPATGTPQSQPIIQHAAALLLLLLHSAAGSLTTLKDDAQFEAEVVQDPVVWGVLFTSKTRDDDAKSKAMLQAAHGLAAGLGHLMRWGRADIQDCKAFASEFNVRTRMVPRVLLFSSRARMADVIRLEGEPTEDALEAAVRAALGDQVSDEARWMKTTLAIGGKEDL